MARNGQRRVTLKSIADKTGFSVNTVSKALRDKSDLSGKTRDLIRETARELGYVANSMAGALRSGITHTIALIVSDISNPFFSIIAKELDNVAQQHGYATIILNTEEDIQREDSMIRLTIAKNVDGVLLFPTQLGMDSIHNLKKMGIPCVVIGRHFDDMRIDCVHVDDRMGGYLATEHLLHSGRRRIAMLNGPMHISSARDRLAGYREALKAYGLGQKDEHVITVSSALGGVERSIREELERGPAFDGVFAFSDMIAFECVTTMALMGYRVPEDIGVVGFDDIQSNLVLPFALTSISSKKSALAYSSFEILLRRMQGDYSDFPLSNVLKTELVTRRSSAPREHSSASVFATSDPVPPIVEFDE